MKYLIASDLHGSWAWTEKLLNKFKEEKADKLILLGDLYYHGPRNPLPDEYAPMRVAEALNNIKDKLIVVQGNCDAEVDQMISEFNFEQSVVLEMFGKKVFISHGHKFNADNLPQEDFDVMFFGHFHVPEITEKDKKLFINVGSVALPKNDSEHSYVVVDETGILLKSLEE